MINKIFLFIFLVGIVYGGIKGRADLIVDTILSTPKEAFLLFVDMYSLLIFWSGILQICNDSGLLNILSKYFIYIIRPLFKKIDKNDVALKYISMNLMANMLSMGSAATPFGLKAMKRLDELNNHSSIASDEMITFLLINTAGFCLIPTTLIAIRGQYLSNNPVLIIPFILIISGICTIISISIDIGGRKIAKR